jgi:hypothetical protein
LAAQVIEWVQRAGQWSSAAPLLIVVGLALIEAMVLPRRLAAKGAWMLVVVAVGIVAFKTAEWQRQGMAGAARSAIEEQLTALRGLWAQWDAVGQSLPAPPSAKPAAAFDTVDDAVASLSAQVAGISGQIEALREQSKGRSVASETAVKLADYLRPFGAHRVVVSCPPDDVEAYTYANQLANILRAAGWDALGPELTATLAEAPSFVVSLYVRDPRAPEAARILLDAFARFNIPSRPGIAANEAIPDAATAELFVAKKP